VRKTRKPDFSHALFPCKKNPQHGQGVGYNACTVSCISSTDSKLYFSVRVVKSTPVSFKVYDYPKESNSMEHSIFHKLSLDTSWLSQNPECSLPCWKQPATGPYPVLHESTSHPPTVFEHPFQYYSPTYKISLTVSSLQVLQLNILYFSQPSCACYMGHSSHSVWSHCCLVPSAHLFCA
jgi:hypothetical protein